MREPAADLGIAVAVASACRDQPVPAGTLWVGEVGLGGELRAVGQAAERLQEAKKLGFRRAVVPRACQKGLRVPDGLEIAAAGSLPEALELASLSALAGKEKSQLR